MKFKLTFSFMLVTVNLLYLTSATSGLQFTSQNGQDEYIIKNFFTENGIIKKNGFFIEFGAFDGITFSNTYVLEKLGWNGICIEPIPSVFPKLLQNRSCICIEGCVSDKEGTAQFRQIGDGYEVLSGLADKYDIEHIELIENIYKKPSEYYSVKCFTLSQILHDHNVEKIDLLCIDVEGGELGILKTISDEEFKKIDVICVEDNYRNPEFITFLESKNFKFMHRMVQDIIFRNKDFINS